MRKLGVGLVLLLTLALVIGAVGCGSTGGSPNSEAINKFFGDDHAIDILEGYNDIVIDAHYIFNTSRLSRDACSLLKRVNKNREEIVDKDPPEVLLAFWVTLFESSVRLTWALQEFCTQGLTQTAIDQWALFLEERENAHSKLEELLAEYE